jgi:hypothetical protein
MTTVGNDTRVKVRMLLQVLKQWFGGGSQWSSTESEQVSSSMIILVLYRGKYLVLVAFGLSIGMYV